jgi:hypothetical protein
MAESRDCWGAESGEIVASCQRPWDGHFRHLHRKSADYRSRVKRKMRRLSCLHPGRSCCPGTAPVSCRHCTQACLGLLRVLAANHSSWHLAIRICRSKRATTVTSGISPGARKKRFSSEIHRRSTRHAKYADLSLGFMTKKRDS